MSGELNFDSRGVEPAKPFEPIPNGDYVVHIVDSDVANAKSGNGRYLKLELEVVDGPYKGRKIFDMITLVNDNTQAQEIGQRQLSAVCHAVGVPVLQNSSQLHFLPLIARVRIKQEQGYEPQNKVSSYKAVEGAAPVATAAAPAAPATPPAQAPAWAKQKA